MRNYWEDGQEKYGKIGTYGKHLVNDGKYTRTHLESMGDFPPPVNLENMRRNHL